MLAVPEIVLIVKVGTCETVGEGDGVGDGNVGDAVDVCERVGDVDGVGVRETVSVAVWLQQHPSNVASTSKDSNSQARLWGNRGG